LAERWKSESDNIWWRLYFVKYPEITTEEKIKWLWNKQDIPNLLKLICVNDPEENNDWLVLESFSMWTEQDDEDKIHRRDTWYRIQSCIVDIDDLDKIVSHFKGQTLQDGHDPSVA
jgi:hypothetical protein